MNLPVTALFLALFLPTLAGTLALRWLLRRWDLPWGLSIALGYGLGCGLLGQGMLIVGMFGLPLTRLTTTGPLLVVALVSAVAWGRNVATRKPLPWAADPAGSWGRRVFIAVILALIGVQVSAAFWRAWLVPVSCWDGLESIAYAAKVFFYQHGLYQPARLFHPSYPLQVPFLQTWTSFNVGAWDEQAVKMVFPAASLAYIQIHYSYLRLHTNRAWALGGVGVLLTSALLTFHATIEYRDLFMMFFNCGALWLMLMRLRIQDDALLVAAGLFSGFMTFTKLEGLMYLGIHVLVLMWVLRATADTAPVLRRVMRFLLPACGICGMYLVFKWAAGIPLTERTGLAVTEPLMSRAGVIAREFWEELFLRGNWGVVWALLFAGLTQWPAICRRRETQMLLVILALFIGGYALLFLFTGNFDWISGDRSRTGLSRLFLHFYPLAAAALTLMFAPLSNRRGGS